MITRRDASVALLSVVTTLAAVAGLNAGSEILNSRVFDWKDFTEAFPAFVTILATPLTFSIATGLSLGLISYTLVKVAAGKFRDVSLVLWILTALFILRYIYLASG